MNRHLLRSLLCLFFLLQSAPDVLSDQFDFGIGYTGLSICDDADTTDFELVGLGVGFNIPFYRPADNIAFGINPQIGGSFGAISESGKNPLGTLDFPVLLTLKLNTDAAERGTKARFGATIGIGAQYSHLAFTDREASGGYLAPVALAEINAGRRQESIGLVKFRATAQLAPADVEITRFRPFAVNRFSLYLFWTPGY